MLHDLFELLGVGCCGVAFRPVLSSCWCQDDAGVAPRIRQGEGNKASVHLLIALEEHGPLQAMQWQIQDFGRLFAHLDDVSRSESWDGVFRKSSCRTLTSNSIRGRRKFGTLWASGPLLVTFSSGLHFVEVLGPPLGHPDFVVSHLERTNAEHELLSLKDCRSVPDVHFLFRCALTRSTYLFRPMQTTLTEQFARTHDVAL